MTDTEKKIAEIREALEKATPGPWAVFVGEGWTEEYPRNTYVQAVWNEPDHRGSFGYRVARMAGVHGKTMADAHLIANAPEWLRFLLDELERLEQERNMYKASSEVFYERLKKEAEKREKMVECLRFYERMARGREANDGGRRARTLLAEIGVMVE